MKNPKVLATFVAIVGVCSPAIGQSKVKKYISSLPKQAINAAERADLIAMRQEEKLARDVYRVLYQVHKTPAFANIAQSEQSHMDLVKFVLDRYSIPDPIKSDQVGVYRDPVFRGLFEALVLFGAQSQAHAELVGAFIEDLDIFDLDAALARSDNRDLDTLWQNLQLGSRNHLRAYYKLLLKRQIRYPGIVLPLSRILAIVNSPQERGAVDENGKRL